MHVALIQTEEQLETIEGWYRARKIPPVPRGILPATGLLVSRDDIPLMAAWLYQDKSVPVAWLAWPIANPENSPHTSARALRVLAGAAQRLVQERDGAVLTILTDRPSIARVLQREGFILSQQNAIQLIKTTKGSRPWDFPQEP